MTHLPAHSLRAALLAGALFAPVLVPVAAHAQDSAAPAAGPAPAETAAPGEIVVTARFRNESLQSVPLAISAVSGTALNDRALHTLQDLSASVPSLNFRNGASNKDRSLIIRGVGTVTTSQGIEPSVSTVLDGVVLSRPGMSTLDVGEVERVEVLRGPQGTLFGKNASAGVISIVTKAPTEAFHAYGEVGATTDAEYRVKAGVTGAIANNIAARVDGLYANYAGNVNNLGTGNKVNGYERYGVRARIDANPTPNLKMSLEGDYLHSYDNTPNGVFVSTSQTAYPTGVTTNSAALAANLAGSGITASPTNRTVSSNFDSDVRDQNAGVALTSNLSLPGGYGITSISAYRNWRNHQRQDYDGLSTLSASFPQGADKGDLAAHQLSQELRLTSPKGKLIDYVLGAYYLHAVDDERYQRDLTTTTASNTGIAYYGTKADNFALFGEANVNFTSRFRAFAGYRSTWDWISYYHTRTSTNDPTNSGASSLDVSGIRAYHNSTGRTSARGDSWRVGLQYDVADHNQIYATYARGYKGPGFNTYFNMRSLAGQPLDEQALAPETSKSWEVGLKGSLVHRQITYAVALYTTDFNNFQANYNDVVAGAQVTRAINAGTANTRGVEVDLGLHPVPGLNFDTGMSYTDAKILHFNCPVGAPTSCNIDGQTLPFSPHWKLSESAGYRFAIANGWDLELQTDVNLRSATQFSLTQTPSTIQPGYLLWNGSVALLGQDNGWQLRAYVKNITNQHYVNGLGNGTFAGTVALIPRDAVRYGGVMVRKEF